MVLIWSKFTASSMLSYVTMCVAHLEWGQHLENI